MHSKFLSIIILATASTLNALPYQAHQDIARGAVTGGDDGLEARQSGPPFEHAHEKPPRSVNARQSGPPNEHSHTRPPVTRSPQREIDYEWVDTPPQSVKARQGIDGLKDKSHETKHNPPAPRFVKARQSGPPNEHSHTRPPPVPRSPQGEINFK